MKKYLLLGSALLALSLASPAFAGGGGGGMGGHMPPSPPHPVSIPKAWCPPKSVHVSPPKLTPKATAVSKSSATAYGGNAKAYGGNASSNSTGGAGGSASVTASPTINVWTGASTSSSNLNVDTLFIAGGVGFAGYELGQMNNQPFTPVYTEQAFMPEALPTCQPGVNRFRYHGHWVLCEKAENPSGHQFAKQPTVQPVVPTAAPAQEPATSRLTASE